jgi:DNA-binding response OmpR family regulator
LLAQQQGSVVKVEDIIQKVWPENKRATSADVHQYVYILRHKMEENPHKPKILLTVKGFGYRLCP